MPEVIPCISYSCMVVSKHIFSVALSHLAHTFFVALLYLKLE